MPLAAAGSTGTRQVRPSQKEMLGRFLEAYWLRPENALWMTLRSEALAQCTFDRPSADLCCGDGIFSFLHHGGLFDPAFDVFWPSAALPEGADTRADMFDHVTDDYRPPIRYPAPTTIDLGTDVKPAFLTKAGRLKLYGQLVQQDHNHALPWPPGTFQTVHCNAAYWLTNIEGFLAELRRIVAPGGKVILQVKLDSFHRYSLARNHRQLGDRFLERIIGHRLDSWPTLASRAVWESRFEAAGLVIDRETPFTAKTHMQIWEIGLRPIAPLLMKMANGIGSSSRAAIKRDWVALILDLAEPFCQPEFTLSDTTAEPGEIQYVLV